VKFGVWGVKSEVKRRIITSPNILTEVDNILNRITGEDKYKYLILVKTIYKQTIEKYIKTETISQNWHFGALGITDSAILMMAKESELLTPNSA
jgi:hypothetical protein